MGEKGVALANRIASNILGGYVRQVLAQIYARNGEPDKALALLEELLQRSGYISPGWVRYDPSYTFLRGTLRFEKLVDSTPVVIK